MGHQPSKERKDSPRTPVSILLVDDTPAKLLTYEVMLGELGEKLIKAGSVEEAFAVLLKSDVALVIKIGAVLMRDEEGLRMMADVKSLRNAGSDDLAFFDNRKYAGQLTATQAGACILASANAKRAPRATATLTTAMPYNAFAQAHRLFYLALYAARQPVEARMRAVRSWIRPPALLIFRMTI
jgi:CheY-like chemotaxis protein